MKQKLQFTPIDLRAWPRGETFYYFSQMAPTGYSLTVELDVTRLRAALKDKGYKFFPAYLWLVTKCLNEQPEFRLAEADGQLGCYNVLTPLYANFHEDDHTFSLLWILPPFTPHTLRTRRNTALGTAFWAGRVSCRRRTPIPSPVCHGCAFSILLSTPMKARHIIFPPLRRENSAKGAEKRFFLSR